MSAVLLATTACLLAPLSTDQVLAVDLEDVPDPLSFPLPEGSNRILTARVTGGDACRVWLVQEHDRNTTTPWIPLTASGDGTYRINLSGRTVLEALARHGSDGEFRIHAEASDGATADSIAVRYVLAAVPTKLDFPWDRARLTVPQRHTRHLPGTHGGVRLRLGDITGGHVYVSITDARGRQIVETVYMREGDTVTIPLAAQTYILRLDDMVNLLIGQDYASFTLMPESAWETSRIDALLERVAAADVLFLRGNEEMTGEAFAAHLRVKHAHFGPYDATLKRFIDEVATRSTVSGDPYQVRLSDGKIVPAAEWLRTHCSPQKD